jgi:hypothetical protein
MGTLSKRLVEGSGAFLCDFRWDQDGVETEKRGETRKKTGEDDQTGKIGVAQFLAKSSSKCSVTLQFLCTVCSSGCLFWAW